MYKHYACSTTTTTLLHTQLSESSLGCQLSELCLRTINGNMLTQKHDIRLI